MFCYLLVLLSHDDNVMLQLARAQPLRINLEDERNEILSRFRPLVTGELLSVELILGDAPSCQIRTHGREDEVHVGVIRDNGNATPANQFIEIMRRSHILEQTALGGHILLLFGLCGITPQFGQ